MFVTGYAIPVPGTREQSHPQSEKKTFLKERTMFLDPRSMT